MHIHTTESPLDSRKALDGECKTLLVLGVYSPFGIILTLYQCSNQSDYGQSEARLTQQAVATAFLLQKQLYVYGKPVWRLFLKKEVNKWVCHISLCICTYIYTPNNSCLERYCIKD